MPSTAAITEQSVLDALAWHVGAAYGVHAPQLAREASGGDASPAAQRRLRHVIEQLRLKGSHICGTPSTGYYMAATTDELAHNQRFLLARVRTTLQQIAAQNHVSLPDLEGQLRIPT